MINFCVLCPASYVDGTQVAGIDRSQPSLKRIFDRDQPISAPCELCRRDLMRFRGKIRADQENYEASSCWTLRRVGQPVGLGVHISQTIKSL